MFKKIIKKIITAIILLEARLVLKKYKPKIVAVTGSVGKTSTKDAIYTVLSKFYFIRKSSKSFNSEIGVPLTILGCANAWSSPSKWLKNIFEGLALIILPNKYPEWLVLEVGVDKPGDMDFITSWLKSDVVVVTRLSKIPVHVEFFPSVQSVFEEKGKLVKAVKPNGVVILNADDEDVLAYKNITSANTILFSTQGHADLVASEYSVIYEGEVATSSSTNNERPTGIRFRLDHSGQSLHINIKNSLGYQHIQTCLAALSVGLSQNLDLNKLVEALSQYDTPPGRMKLIDGLKHTTIIDDTYNSSPIALSLALETLGFVQGKRKIAVLGDMLELGKYSTEEHKKAGARVAEHADLLVTVGIRARFIAEGALEAGMKEKKIVRFEDSIKAGDYLSKIIKRGDIILVKGSQSMRMERAVKMMMAEPNKAHEFLVRQEEDWLKR